MNKNTKARKPLLKLNLRKPYLRPEKGSSFEVVSLLQTDQVWESFLRQSGWLPTRKRRTVLFLLPVKELNTVRMRTMYYLRSSQVIRSSFFYEIIKFVVLNKESYVTSIGSISMEEKLKLFISLPWIHWMRLWIMMQGLKYLDIETWKRYQLVALDTLYASCGSWCRCLINETNLTVIWLSPTRQKFVILFQTT